MATQEPGCFGGCGQPVLRYTNEPGLRCTGRRCTNEPGLRCTNVSLCPHVNTLTAAIISPYTQAGASICPHVNT